MGKEHVSTEQHRFAKLLPVVRLADTVESVDTRVVPDPESGRDTDRDFVIRYAS